MYYVDIHGICTMYVHGMSLTWDQPFFSCAPPRVFFYAHAMCLYYAIMLLCMYRMHNNASPGTSPSSMHMRYVCIMLLCMYEYMYFAYTVCITKPHLGPALLLLRPPQGGRQWHRLKVQAHRHLRPHGDLLVS